MMHSICLVCVKIVYRLFQIACAIALPFLWALFVVVWLVTTIADFLTGSNQK